MYYKFQVYRENGRHCKCFNQFHNQNEKELDWLISLAKLQKLDLFTVLE